MLDVFTQISSVPIGRNKTVVKDPVLYVYCRL